MRMYSVKIHGSNLIENEKGVLALLETELEALEIKGKLLIIEPIEISQSEIDALPEFMGF